MPRTLSTNLSTATSERVTAPGYYVQIAFTGPSEGEALWRGSSRGPLTLPGLIEGSPIIAPRAGIQVSGIAVDGTKSAQTGSVTILDQDGALARQILTYGIGDRPVLIQAFYGDGVPDAADYVTIFQGVADDADIDPQARTVTIRLQQESGQTLFAPRRYITRENGFSVLPPDGQIIVVGNETYTLQSEVT